MRANSYESTLTDTCATLETMFTAMDRSALEELERRIPIGHGLQAELQWQPDRRLAPHHLTGLCPLHPEKRPSFSIRSARDFRPAARGRLARCSPRVWPASPRLDCGPPSPTTRRVIVPLPAEEEARFWRRFRTFRDLALVGLMLLDGLRSCEILHLQLEDLQLADGQARVLGKGDQQRVLPLPGEITPVLEN